MLSRPFFVHAAVTALSLLAAANAFAAEWSAKKEAAPVPSGVSDAIKGLLSEESVVMSKDGAAELSFWFVKELPLGAKPESPDKALEQVAEGQLVGVVEVHADRRDYRDDEMLAGVYTVRMGLRPNDGDHLGSSDYLFFGVLIPVSKDKTVAGYPGHERLAEASAEETAVFHPSIISFRPDSKSDSEPLSVYEVAEDHKVIRVTVPSKAADSVDPLSFEVVVEGEARH